MSSHSLVDVVYDTASDLHAVRPLHWPYLAMVCDPTLLVAANMYPHGSLVAPVTLVKIKLQIGLPETVRPNIPSPT